MTLCRCTSTNGSQSQMLSLSHSTTRTTLDKVLLACHICWNDIETCITVSFHLLIPISPFTIRREDHVLPCIGYVIHNGQLIFPD